MRRFIWFCTLTVLVSGFPHKLKAQIYEVDTTRSFLRELRAQQADSIEQARLFVRAYRILAEFTPDSYEKSIEYLSIALQLSVEHADNFELLPTISLQGEYYAGRGQYAKAVDAYLEALSLNMFKDNRHTEQEGWFLTSFGNLLYRIELYKEAQVYYQRAYRHFETSSHFGKSVALNNLGLCQLRLNSPGRALKYFSKALALRRDSLDNRLMVAHSMLHFAQAYLALNRTSDADTALQLAEKFSKGQKDIIFEKEIYLLWAEVALERSNEKKARYYLRQSGEHQIGLLDEIRNSEMVRLMSESFAQEGDLDSAIFYAELGLKTAIKQDQLYQQRTFLNLLIDFQAQLGKDAKYVGLLEQLNTLNQEELAKRNEVLIDLVRYEERQNENLANLARLNARSSNQKELIQYQWYFLAFALLLVILGFAASSIFYRLSRKLKRARNRIEEFSKRTVIIANAIDQAILSLDQRGRIIFYNKAAYSFFKKFLRAELKNGEHFLAVIGHSASKTYWRNQIERGSENRSWQQAAQHEVDGELRHFLHSFASVEIKGEFQGMAIVITDLTPSLQRNLDLAKKSQQLEVALAEKDRIISLLAHDLKDGIFNSLELTEVALQSREETSAGESREFIQLINQRLSKTKALLTKTLDWVRGQKKDGNLRLVTISLKAITEDVLRNLNDKIEAKGIEVNVDLEESLQVVTDPEILRTVLRNLINNAIKFVEHAKGRIEIFYNLEGQERIALHIKDNGVGIEGTLMEKIVSQRNISSANGTNGESGTGVGLKLCQDMLAILDSSLQIISEKGYGSDFYFTLEKSTVKLKI